MEHDDDYCDEWFKLWQTSAQAWDAAELWEYSDSTPAACAFHVAGLLWQQYAALLTIDQQNSAHKSWATTVSDPNTANYVSLECETQKTNVLT